MTRPIRFLALLVAGGVASAAAAQQGTSAQGASALVPLGLDLHVPFPADNPITAAKADLGRRLFFETRISADGETSCATCHQPERAFTDGRSVAVGVYGRDGQRNTPSILNRAYGERFFWDGRTATLEQQVADAQAGAADLGLPPEEAAGRLRGDRAYESAFSAAFAAASRSTAQARGRSAAPMATEPVGISGSGQGARLAGVDGGTSSSITGERLIAAIATFVRTQLSANSPADRYAAGDRHALTPAAERGHAIFYGKGRCGLCHSGPLFSDEALHNTGVGWGSADSGRMAVTGEEGDRGRFKTPSLRNVALTAPYMHDGSIETLEQVIDFYDRGADPNPNLDPIVRPLGLAPGDKAALLEFLRSLTSAAAAHETTAIVGATLFDGTGAPAHENATIVIEGDRIRAVGPGDRTPVPPGARILDAAGKYVIPGLADMHNHIGQPGFGRAVSREVLRDLLGWGVTTVFHPAGTWSEYRELRAIAASETVVPRVLLIGQTFSAAGGWGGAGYTPQSPAEAESAIDELAAAGADAVKLIYDDMSVFRPTADLPMMHPDVMQAVIRSAHAHGLKVFVHALEFENAKEVIRAGADGLVHAVVDLPVDNEFLELMRDSGAVYMSTQSLFEAQDVRAMTRRIVDLDPGGIDAHPTYRVILSDERFTADAWGEPLGLLARSNLKAVFDAGIPLVIGTDTGANPALVPGIATHMELLLHVESGIEPAEVLLAATRNAARMLDLDDEQGTVEAGKLADLLILDADPLEDIRNTTRIHRIVKGGIFYDPEKIRR